MLRLLQNLSSYFSIKTIVIFGVVIMGLVIIAFGLTMNYLSSAIKSDQNTLKHIISLEKQNQTILNTIKDLNYLDTQILMSSSLENLEKFEKELLKNQKYDLILAFYQNDDYISKHNLEVKNISTLINKEINIQNKIYESKSIILFYENNLVEYKNKIEKHIKNISIETESIYGIASLAMQRYNRKIKNIHNYKNDNLNKIMTLTKDLDSSILKLPTLIYSIINANNEDIINSINANNLSQLSLLIENSLIKIMKFESFINNFEDSIEKINSEYRQINELRTFIIISKKQLLKENRKIEKLILIKNDINRKIFKNLDILNNISNGIKIDILNHSDKVSKQTTLIIFIVGIIFLTLISLSAATLISRINVPLSFILKYINGITLNKRSLSSHLPIFRDDEFGKLSKSFNKMTETINTNIKEIEHLNKEIVNTQKEVIFTMGAIGESRSKETGNHVKRVAEYSRLLAIKYGLDEQTSELLKEASPMHDIGKVGIPDSILKKPGVLVGQEWKIMKTHAALGYEMLKYSKREILKTAAIVAYEHHEKWDGTGYPRGLKGKDIHIYGRITAVADVFDALGSDRCYKKAWPLIEIEQYFIENRGKHFDPDLIDVFFNNIDEFLLIRKKYEDTFD